MVEVGGMSRSLWMFFYSTALSEQRGSYVALYCGLRDETAAPKGFKGSSREESNWIHDEAGIDVVCFGMSVRKVSFISPNLWCIFNFFCESPQWSEHLFSVLDCFYHANLMRLHGHVNVYRLLLWSWQGIKFGFEVDEATARLSTFAPLLTRGCCCVCLHSTECFYCKIQS